MRVARPPVVLVVLDGWGLSKDPNHNAILLGRTPTYDELLERYPSGSLITSGTAVGLPEGQMGNSEVGHMNLGAGRVVYQNLSRIDNSISDGDFFSNNALLAAAAQCVDDRHTLHLIGLVSDGGVHSHLRHLVALIDFARRQGVTRLFVHALTDGRDTSPVGAADYLPAVELAMRTSGIGRIASVIGRYYGMDRDKRWGRTKQAFDALAYGHGRHAADASTLVANSHTKGITDEFLEPGVVVDADGRPVGLCRDGDAVVFFNFRADRARQLTSALAFDDERFTGFDRGNRPQLAVTTLTEYDATYGLPIAFEPAAFSGNVAEVLASNGRTNLRLAETEKYAHVTYFFNSGDETPYAGEDRILIPSPKVPTYDLTPDMSAVGVTDQLVADVEQQRHDVIICNFANADMVGHTGKLEATVRAVSTLDRCVARIVDTITAADGSVIITADHGNAEQLWDQKRSGPHTAHTSNPVPVLLINKEVANRGFSLRNGSLRDVAPTLLRLAGVDVPPEMTGQDLRTWTD